MAYVDKINVQGTDYDIQDKRLPESDGTVVLNKNFQANGISGSEIVERMSGYEFNFSDNTENLTLNVTYAGAVKNGNKLTLVIFGDMTRTGTMSTSYLDYKLRFIVPSSVADKLYPVSIGGINLLDDKSVELISEDDYSTRIEKTLLIYKGGTTLAFNIYAVDSLTLNKKHTFRIEVTFLLSDNLAA